MKHMLFTFIILTGFLLNGAEPSAKITVLSGSPPKIDGKIGVAEWKDATILKDFVVTRQDTPAQHQTEVFLLRDKEVLYVAAKCFDAEMDKLSVNDWFEIFIAAPSLRIYYHFWVYSNGGSGQDGSPGLFLFDAPQWQAKISKNKDRWEVEVAIPFFNLSPDYMDTDEWRFNICREKVSGTSENTQWSQTGGSFHTPERFGRLSGMKGLNFIPSAEVAQRMRSENYEEHLLPSYFLLDRSYYTTEKSAEMKLYMDNALLKKLGRSGELNVNIGEKKLSFPVTASKSACYHSYSLEGIANGTHSLTAELSVGGKVIKTFNSELVKLAPTTNEVKINRFTRLLIVDGKPFIPLICEVMMYGTRLGDKNAPDDGLEIMCRESGFNTINFWWLHPIEAMSVCHKNNVKAFPALVDIMAKKPPRDEFWRKAIAEFSKEPNLIGYLIADEGNIGGSEADYVKTYKLLKSLDPYHPFFRNESGWFIGCGGPGGLNTTDIFCGGYGSASSAKAVSIDGIPHGAPVFLCQELWGVPEKHRYPSGKETECWVWQILINGATGAFWWGANGGRLPVPLWDTIRKLRNEIDQLTPVFNTEPIEASVTCANANITSTLRFYDGKYYLITVNLTDNVQQGVFKLSGELFSASGSAELLFEPGNVPYSQSKLKVDYAPMERKVLRINKE